MSESYFLVQALSLITEIYLIYGHGKLVHKITTQSEKEFELIHTEVLTFVLIKLIFLTLIHSATLTDRYRLFGQFADKKVKEIKNFDNYIHMLWQKFDFYSKHRIMSYKPNGPELQENMPDEGFNPRSDMGLCGKTTSIFNPKNSKLADALFSVNSTSGIEEGLTLNDALSNDNQQEESSIILTSFDQRSSKKNKSEKKSISKLKTVDEIKEGKSNRKEHC